MSDKSAETKQLAKVWENPRGWRYLTNVNNSVVGLWYFAAAFAFCIWKKFELGIKLSPTESVPSGFGA